MCTAVVENKELAPRVDFHSFFMEDSWSNNVCINSPLLQALVATH
jgi:hypothetical protein